MARSRYAFAAGDEVGEQPSDALDLTPEDLRKLSEDDFQRVAAQVLRLQQTDTQENALRYYQPVSDKARAIHESTAHIVGVGGGNGSSKTETVLVELVACATGVVPESLRDGIDWDEKLKKGPLHCRIIVESLTTTLETIILPKLQWWQWTGIDRPYGQRGHWGWVPRDALIDRSWDKSWSAKLRLLRMLYRNPKTGQIEGESTIQFMSHDQDPTDFASGDFDLVMMDEPPKLAIYTENEARTMRVNGRMFLAMTWPDDPAIPVDWIFDKIYDKAHGLNKDPGIDWFNLWTRDNRNLDQDAVEAQASRWDEQTKAVRLRGEPIRFSNRIHPLFTDSDSWWCYVCGQSTFGENGRCGNCETLNIGPYNHVQEFDIGNWPAVFLLDPHPRKPHMFLWAAVDGNDDWWIIADGDCENGVEATREKVFEMEREYEIATQMRLIDPNMGRSPASAHHREITWQDEFDEVGLACDLANDSSTGRERLNDFLKPDKDLLRPRIHVHRRCANTIHQMKRYRWDDFKKSLEKDVKQKPKDKEDDYPTLLKYLMNTGLRFEDLRDGYEILHRRAAARR